MMQVRRTLWPFFALACLFLLVACSNSQPEVVEITRVVMETVIEEGMQPTVPIGTATVPIGTAVAQDPGQQRLIIKNGDMAITVEDTETAVTQATGATVQFGGYIINQQVWNDEHGYRFATLRVGVPVLRFEEALRAFRELGAVTNETASGQDVTDQYVDLQSRLVNLIATRDRLRTFLDEATTIEEALRVNEELKVVEEEIAVLQGRLNYLADRAAFSTIDLALNPWIPTPTPSPTPTSTPIPTAQAWHPGNTAKLATVELQESAQSTAGFGLYYGIVCGPWLLLFGLAGLVGWKLTTWWRKR